MQQTIISFLLEEEENEAREPAERVRKKPKLSGSAKTTEYRDKAFDPQEGQASIYIRSKSHADEVILSLVNI
jgi:hypothetical protein